MSSSSHMTWTAYSPGSLGQYFTSHDPSFWSSHSIFAWDGPSMAKPTKEHKHVRIVKSDNYGFAHRTLKDVQHLKCFFKVSSHPQQRLLSLQQVWLEATPSIHFILLQGRPRDAHYRRCISRANRAKSYFATAFATPAKATLGAGGKSMAKADWTESYLPVIVYIYINLYPAYTWGR